MVINAELTFPFEAYVSLLEASEMGDNQGAPTLQRGWDVRKKMSCAATRKAKEARYKTATSKYLC